MKYSYKSPPTLRDCFSFPYSSMLLGGEISFGKIFSGFLSKIYFCYDFLIFSSSGLKTLYIGGNTILHIPESLIQIF